MLALYIWVNYNDLTATSLESWLIGEIIPKWSCWGPCPTGNGEEEEVLIQVGELL